MRHYRRKVYDRRHNYQRRYSRVNVQIEIDGSIIISVTVLSANLNRPEKTVQKRFKKVNLFRQAES